VWPGCHRGSRQDSGRSLARPRRWSSYRWRGSARTRRWDQTWRLLRKNRGRAYAIRGAGCWLPGAGCWCRVPRARGIYCDAIQMAGVDRLGEFEHAVLVAIVHLDDDAYGVTIRREIEARTRRAVAIGALYTALERLERKGYVTSTMSPPTPQRGGRSKRHFT